MSGPPQPPPLQTSPAAGTGFFAAGNMLTPLTPDYDDVESPSLTSGNALARFEFEKPSGHDSRDGTKVLMVEWEDDEKTKQIRGEWSVGWDGKQAAVLGANTTDGSREGLHRLYFLLPAGERVPGTVTLTLQSAEEQDKQSPTTVWRTHPLPAIFPPELGASARQAGKKGVLHTVWAKKRLQVLKHEIQHEEERDPESAALTMATQERDWIESKFGVRTKPQSLNISVPSRSDNVNVGLPSPASPRSPGRGPLLDKLKALTLDTAEPTPAPAVPKEQNPLSPEGSDVAVNFNSFAALHGLPDPSSLAAKPAQQPQPPTTIPQQKRMAPQLPPASILAQQRQQAGNNMPSLDAFAVNDPPISFESMIPPSRVTRNDSAADEDDLFALPLSPRSPADQNRGAAFSFDAIDTARYTQ